MVVFHFHQCGCNQKIRRRFVVGNGDIINLCDTQQRLDIRVVGLRCQRIGKKDDEINLSLHDFSADLQVSPQRAAVVSPYRQAGAVGDHPGGRSGTVKEMLL